MANTLSSTAAVILAAGRGTRMNAKRKNKVAFNLGGRPMIARTVENLKKAGIGQIIVVVGYQSESVKSALGSSVEYAAQVEQLGTGDALKCALPVVRTGIDTVLSVSGDDSAFYPPQLYQEMVSKQKNDNVPLLFLTIHKNDPAGLGRIVRGHAGQVKRIVEEKVATDEEKKIQEINTGFYCFDRKFLTEYIDKISKNPVSGEYYVTDLVEIALAGGKRVETLQAPDSSIWQGVNSRRDLVIARNKL